MKIFFITKDNIEDLRKNNTIHGVIDTVIFVIFVILEFFIGHMFHINFSQYGFMSKLSINQRIFLLIPFTVSFYEVFNFLNLLKSLGFYKIKIGETHKYIRLFVYFLKWASAYSLALGTLNHGWIQFWILLSIPIVLFLSVVYDLIKYLNGEKIRKIHNKDLCHKKFVNKIKFIINNSNITKYDILQIFDNM